MEPEELQRKLVQIEIDKFAMEKQLSSLKHRLVAGEFSWPEYQAFKAQLLEGKNERQYFAEANQQVQTIRTWLDYKNQSLPHKQHFFFAGLLVFFLLALITAWQFGTPGTESFVIKESKENTIASSAALDRQVFVLGEPVNIRISPENTPYILSVTHNDQQIAFSEPVFIPEETGNYQVIAWLEADNLEEFRLDFVVVNYRPAQ